MSTVNFTETQFQLFVLVTVCLFTYMMVYIGTDNPGELFDKFKRKVSSTGL